MKREKESFTRTITTKATETEWNQLERLCSQGQTTDRVLRNVNSELGEKLVNERLAYVAVSRARYDAQIYTNDQAELARDLSREYSHSTATDGHSQENGHEITQSYDSQYGISHSSEDGSLEQSLAESGDASAGAEQGQIHWGGVIGHPAPIR